MKDNSLFLILAAVVIYFLQRGQQNDESWEVHRDENGRLVSISVHRQVRSNWGDRTQKQQENLFR